MTPSRGEVPYMGLGVGRAVCSRAWAEMSAGLPRSVWGGPAEDSISAPLPVPVGTLWRWTQPDRRGQGGGGAWPLCGTPIYRRYPDGRDNTVIPDRRYFAVIRTADITAVCDRTLVRQAARFPVANNRNRLSSRAVPRAVAHRHGAPSADRPTRNASSTLNQITLAPRFRTRHTRPCQA
jgi:hypothetical protein